MNIFADFHHQGLFASLHYLLEDRLGHKLYRPIGIEWFKEGYWKIAEPYNNDIGTVNQYLRRDSVPEDGTNPLNDVGNVRTGGMYSIPDHSHGYNQRAISLPKFRDTNFSFVIASIPAHVQAYRRLIRDTGSKAKLIYQIGNIGWHNNIPWEEVDGIMASVKEFPNPSSKPVVFYRQEFKTELFDSTDSKIENNIISFVNCLPRADYFLQLEQQMPTYSFKSYGITCRDGIYHTVQEIANIMKTARYGYHLKPYGDGYGHVIHNWLAAGKPILVGCDDYKDKLAGELLEDMVTCIDLSKRNPIEVAEIIKSIDENKYQEMVNNVKNRFKEVVNFERDAKNVSEFLNVLMQ